MLETDRKDGKRFASKLMELYNSGFFGSKIHRKFLPPSNARSRERKLLYYFYVLSVDYGMKAEPLFERMRNLHEESAEWFMPEKIAKMSMEDVVMKMRDLKMRFPRQAAERWKRNSVILLEKYGGKIDEVFRGGTEEILKKIESFYGFGPKLSRLLLRVVVDNEIIEPPEGFEDMELPTDVHVVKLAFRSGLLKGEKPDYSRHAGVARKEWTKIAKSIGEMPAALDRALWVLGAEWCARKRCGECRLYNICKFPEINN